MDDDCCNYQLGLSNIEYDDGRLEESDPLLALKDVSKIDAPCWKKEEALYFFA